jgi:hypothetical protein
VKILKIKEEEYHLSQQINSKNLLAFVQLNVGVNFMMLFADRIATVYEKEVFDTYLLLI